MALTGRSGLSGLSQIMGLPGGGPTVPSPPQSLVSGGNATLTTKPLSWTAPASNGGSSITGYKIKYRVFGSGGGYTTVSTGSTNTTYTVTGLSANTKYEMYAMATNAIGDSGTSNEYDGITLPTAPTIGTATAGDGTVSITFTPAGGGTETESFTATSTPGTFTGTGSSPITVTGLTNGTAYTFTVHSTNGGGNSAESSASNSVTPAFTPTSTSPLGWWDADHVSTSGSNVTAFTDLSGNGRDLTDDGSGHATLVSSDINGHASAVTQTSSPHGYTSASNFSTTDYTIFFLGKVASGNNDNGDSVFSWSGTSGAYLSQTTFHGKDLKSSCNGTVTGSKSYASDDFRIHATERSGTTLKTWIDGDYANAASASPNGNALSSGKLVLGARDSANTNPTHNTRIVSAIVFNTVLSTSDRQKIEGYLAWFVGKQANLPAGHPYLDSPP